MKIPIVDENDNILYHKNINEYNVLEEITRSANLWLFDEEGKVLIAKRANNKRFPNMWGPSVAGWPEEAESYENCAIREAKEEIGVSLKSIISGPKYLETDRHQFFTQYFFTKISRDVKFILQKLEVSEVHWISLEELKKWFLEEPEEFIPSFFSSLKAIKSYAN